MTTSFVCRNCMERTSFFKLLRRWLRNFDYLVFFFMITKMREDRLSASTEDFCLKKLLWHIWFLVKAVITLWNIQSGRHSLVIVSVHFEPELTLRQLRGRLGLIHPHWPAFLHGVGIILGDFNICNPEEGRFNVWNQTFTYGDLGKTAVFHSFFPDILEVAQPDYTRRDATSLGVIRTLSRTDRMFVNVPMAEARDSHCSSHVVENLGKETIPSDHAAVRLVIQKPAHL